MKKLITLIILCLTPMILNASVCEKHILKADKAIKRLEEVRIWSARDALSRMALTYIERYKICVEREKSN